MGERVRHDVTLRDAASGRRQLPRPSAWRPRRRQLREVATLVRVARPGPGKAVGLQLGANLQLIGRGVIHSLLHLLYPGQDSEQILHVVANLVRVGTFTANAEMSAIGGKADMTFCTAGVRP